MPSDEWSPMIGIRNVSLRLLLRSVIAIAIWAGMIWLATPMLNYLPAHWAVWAVIGFFLVIVGFAVGYGLCRELPDIAGFSGPLLMIIAVAFVIGTAYASMRVSHAFRPIEEWQRFFLFGGPAAGGIAFALKATLFDD